MVVRHTCQHRSTLQPGPQALVQTGQQGKLERYYFAPQLMAAHDHFECMSVGLDMGTTKADVHRCLVDWDEGNNGILDLSKMCLMLLTGVMISVSVLHATSSVCPYDWHWGTDMFGMYKSLALYGKYLVARQRLASIRPILTIGPYRPTRARIQERENRLASQLITWQRVTVQTPSEHPCVIDVELTDRHFLGSAPCQYLRIVL